jgi:hypothetical protein
MTAMEKQTPSRAGSKLAWGMAAVLIFFASLGNYDLVFSQYQRAYVLSSWNTSEMGRIIHDFGDIYGSTETAYVLPYPYWVDTRLVGMNAGDPSRDYAIPPDLIAKTVNDFRPKMFLLYPEDQADLVLLKQLFPQGNLSIYESDTGKNFYIYLVPQVVTTTGGTPGSGGRVTP